MAGIPQINEELVSKELCNLFNFEDSDTVLALLSSTNGRLTPDIINEVRDLSSEEDESISENLSTPNELYVLMVDPCNMPGSHLPGKFMRWVNEELMTFED